MADFTTHVTGGLCCAAVLAAGAFTVNLLTPIQALVVFTCGAAGSLLPDLDSSSGKPRIWLARLLGICLPVMLYPCVAAFSEFKPAYIAAYLVAGYLLTCLIVRGVLFRLTVHRGALHSVLFALFGAQAAYILFFSVSQPSLALPAAMAVGGGIILHLLLDEFYAVRFKYGFWPVFKRSRGSALKLLGPHRMGNFTLLTLLAVTTLVSGLLYTEGNLTRLQVAVSQISSQLASWF